MQQLQEELNITVSLLNGYQKTVFNEAVITVVPGVTADDLNAALIGALSTTSKVFFLDTSVGTGEFFLTSAIHAFSRLR